MDSAIFRGSVGAVFDIACRAGRSDGRGAEEAALGHEIVFPRRGVFVRHLDSRSGCVADPNHVLFFNRHDAYSVSHPAEGGDDCTVIALAPSVAVEIAAAHEPEAADRPHAPFARPIGSSDARLHLAQRRLVSAARRGAPAIAIEERMLDAAARAVAVASPPRRRRRERPRRPSTARAHRDLAEAVKSLLALRFREKLSLADVAWAVHSSPYHLARVFRSETGSSIRAYFERLRLRSALERLAEGEARDLTALALELGFPSHGHFTHRFRREFGHPPSTLRRCLTPL